MEITGNIIKYSKNKYVWTVNKSGSSPTFSVNGYKTYLLLSLSTTHQNEFIGWDISCYQDSKLASTTGVKIVLKISLESGILSNELLSNNKITPGKSTVLKVTTEFRKYSIDPKLTYRIECEFFNLPIESLTLIKPSPVQAAVSDQKEFQELFDSGKFSDLTIVSKGTKIDVHKCILSARSKVFAAMFKDCFKESEKSKIEIDDIDGDIMKEVIKFLYIGEVTDIDKLAFELVAPADKYMIKGLLALCEETLVKTISLDNIKPMLSLINLYDLPLLKSAAFKILTDDPEFVKSTDFKDFLKKLSPSLLIDMITYIV